MATGDLKNNLRKLQFELRAMKYDRDVDMESLGRGIPAEFLPIYHYAFVEYSCHLAEKILEMHFEMFSKTDLRFIETMYKVLRELFGYKPSITKDQFFNAGYGERKVMMCCNILQLVQEMHKSLAAGKSSAKTTLRANQSIHLITSSSTKKSSHSQSVCSPDVESTQSNSSSTIESGRTSKNQRMPKRLSMNTDSFKSPSLVTRVVAESADEFHAFEDEEEPSAPPHESRSGPVSAGNAGVVCRIGVDKLKSRNNVDQQQAMVESIAEKLSQVLSRLDAVDERTNHLNRVVSEESQRRLPAMTSPVVSASDRSERLLENLVARLTLVENRLNILEKQNNKYNAAQQRFPSLDDLDRHRVNCAGRFGMMETMDELPLESSSQFSSVPAASVAISMPNASPICQSSSKGSTPTLQSFTKDSAPACHSSAEAIPPKAAAEQTLYRTKSQSERISDMLRETDEMLTKSIKISADGSSGYERNDSQEAKSPIFNQGSIDDVCRPSADASNYND